MLDHLQRARRASFSLAIRAEQGEGAGPPLGSGCFVSPAGLFLCAAHSIAAGENELIPGVERLTLRRADGSQPDYGSASLEWISHDLDLAALRFQSPPTPHLPVSFKPLGLGEEVYCLGYPLSEVRFFEPGTISIGERLSRSIVSSTEFGNPPQAYAFDAPWNYGHGGCPVIGPGGAARALISRSQPAHLPGEGGATLVVPSPYSIGVSLASASAELEDLGADVEE